MVYGGWTTPKSMMSAYVEESKMLSQFELDFYKWLVTDLPHRSTTMNLQPAPVDKRARKARKISDL